MRKLLVATILLSWSSTVCLGCGGGLSDADKSDLENIARLTNMAYHYQDASSPAAALDRGAFCAAQALLRDQKLPPVDSGIQCQN